MTVDYTVLQKFLDIDELELNYHRVTNDIDSIDIDDGFDFSIAEFLISRKKLNES